MKYQSELIKEIVDTRGHKQSSLHYKSECIETWIEENKGAYPKLPDYQAEWLNYINENPDNPIGKFPYVTITANPTATVDNVVPLAYKSAILKGKSKLLDSVNNEVNESNHPNIIKGYYLDVSTGNQKSSSNSCITEHFIECPNMPFKIRGDNKYKRIAFYDENKSFISGKDWKATANKDEVISNIPENAKYIKISISLSIDSNTSYTPSTKIELLDNDENNLYLTHLESVEMPVLKAVGKNLFDKDNVNHISGFISSNKTIASTNNVKTYYIKCKSNTNYTISKIKSNYFRFASTNREPIGGSSITTFVGSDTKTSLTITTGLSDNYLCFNIHDVSIASDITEEEILNSIQIEEATQATPYEPFKSNILTVNEDVTLRSNGDICDELNLLTKQLTQRIGEIVLDRTIESRVDIHQPNNSELLIFRLGDVANDGIINTQSVSDKLLWNNTSGMLNYPYSFRLATYGNPATTCLFICLPKSVLSEETANGLLEWLANNPVKIQYPLAAPVVKTVDLTITNQDGETLSKFIPIEGTMHIHSDGTPINPIAVLEVPVEAITQNLSSFIEEE